VGPSHRTRDRVMNLGEYTPESMIPVIFLTWCPLGPSAGDPGGECAIADPVESTPGWGMHVALALRSKKELILTSSSLTDQKEDSTSGFQTAKDWSNAAIVASSVTTRSSRCCVTSSNLVKCIYMAASCAVNPTFISSRMDNICFIRSSNRSLVLGSMEPSCFWRWVNCS
jgi:hypothetical protein